MIINACALTDIDELGIAYLVRLPDLRRSITLLLCKVFLGHILVLGRVLLGLLVEREALVVFSALDFGLDKLNVRLVLGRRKLADVLLLADLRVHNTLLRLGVQLGQQLLSLVLLCINSLILLKPVLGLHGADLVA